MVFFLINHNLHFWNISPSSNILIPTKEKQNAPRWTNLYIYIEPRVIIRQKRTIPRTPSNLFFQIQSVIFRVFSLWFGSYTIRNGGTEDARDVFASFVRAGSKCSYNCIRIQRWSGNFLLFLEWNTTKRMIFFSLWCIGGGSSKLAEIELARCLSGFRTTYFYVQKPLYVSFWELL